METNKPNPPADYQGENQRVTHPAQIASLMTRILDERALLTVTLSGAEAHYKSAVLAVNLEQGHLLMDELHPRDGHARFLKLNKCYAHTRLKGVDVSFVCNLRATRDEGGSALYTVDLPPLLYYRQRRADYRAHVGAGLAVPVRLANKDSASLEGVLQDISLGGIGARIKHQPAVALDVGTTFAECHLQIPESGHIQCGLELRFVAPPDARNFMRIGGRFLDLEKSQARSVAQFVTALERAQMRKRPKD
jgi:c-di-GMP-binding flagellar brake protein YcgR